MHDEYPIQPYADNFIPVIPVEQTGDVCHTETSPFCFSDSTCPCHEHPDLIALVAHQVADGLLTSEEATRTVKGEML